jgi:hypothetical protein
MRALVPEDASAHRTTENTTDVMHVKHTASAVSEQAMRGALQGGDPADNRRKHGRRNECKRDARQFERSFFRRSEGNTIASSLPAGRLDARIGPANPQRYKSVHTLTTGR